MLVMFSAIRCLRYRLYVNITVYATQIKILRERILAQTKILLGYSIYEEPLKKTWLDSHLGKPKKVVEQNMSNINS